MYGKKGWCYVHITTPEDNNTRHTTWQTAVPLGGNTISDTFTQKARKTNYFVVEISELAVLMKEQSRAATIPHQKNREELGILGVRFLHIAPS